MNATHTPGPWEVQSAGNNEWEINSTTRQWKAVANTRANAFGAAEVSAEEAEANARLIAAAPCLLEALANLTEWGRTYTSPNDANSPHDLLVAACHALAQATGKDA